MREQNQRLTAGLSTFYQRDEKRPWFLAADQWTDAYFDAVNPFHASHVRGYVYMYKCDRDDTTEPMTIFDPILAPSNERENNFSFLSNRQNI